MIVKNINLNNFSKKKIPVENINKIETRKNVIVRVENINKIVIK